MTNFDLTTIVSLAIFIPVILYCVYIVIYKTVESSRVNKKFEFPTIEEIEYCKDPVENDNPQIGNFYIRKENADKNPFIYPRCIYRIDSIKKNYYGDLWVKVSTKCYDVNSDPSFASYPTEYIPMKQFVSENSKVFKSKSNNLDTVMNEEKKIDYKKMFHHKNKVQSK